MSPDQKTKLDMALTKDSVATTVMNDSMNVDVTLKADHEDDSLILSNSKKELGRYAISDPNWPLAVAKRLKQHAIARFFKQQLSSQEQQEGLRLDLCLVDDLGKVTNQVAKEIETYREYAYRITNASDDALFYYLLHIGSNDDLTQVWPADPSTYAPDMLALKNGTYTNTTNLLQFSGKDDETFLLITSSIDLFHPATPIAFKMGIYGLSDSQWWLKFMPTDQQHEHQDRSAILYKGFIPYQATVLTLKKRQHNEQYPY